MTRDDAACPLPGALLWFSDLETVSRAGVTWLWHGYLAAGQVTLLTSQWKAGKTTLLSVLLPANWNFTLPRI